MPTGFNVEAARKAGYSDDEILSHLTQSRAFNVNAAVQSGYSKQEIIDHLASTTPSGAKAQSVGPVSRFIKSAVDQVNPVTAIKGLAQAVAHPIETAKALGQAQGEVLQQAGEKIGEGDPYAGAAKILAYLIPILGPQLAKGGEQMQQGDIAGGLGTTAGIAANLAGPAALKAVAPRIGAALGPAAENVATRMYRSAMKPSTKLPLEQSAAAVKTGLREQIPVSAAGVEKLTNLVDDLNQNIAAKIAADPNRPISPVKAIQNTAELEKRFSQQVNPESDLAAIGSSRDEFLNRIITQGGVRNLTAEEAQAIKQGTYVQLRKKYGQLQGASVEAQKALARGLKEEIATQFPEIASLNAREAKLLALEPLLERAVARISNHQLIGIGTPIAGGAAKMITGSSGASAAMGALKAVIDNPAVKSRLAIALTRSGVPMKLAKARIAGYVNALGNAAAEAGQPPAAQTAQ